MRKEYISGKLYLKMKGDLYEKKIKRGYAINIIFGILIMVASVIFMLTYNIVTPYIVKSIPSGLFLLLGIINYVYAIKYMGCNYTKNIQ